MVTEEEAVAAKNGRSPKLEVEVVTVDGPVAVEEGAKNGK